MQTVRASSSLSRRVVDGPLATRFKLRWKFKTGDAVTGQPTVAGNRILVGSEDKNVYCLDLATGKRLWVMQPKEPSRHPRGL